MAAADVGDARAPLQPGHHAVQGGQPAREQVGVVAGAEEPLAAVVDVVHVLVPAEPVTAADLLGDLGRVEHRTDRRLKEPR